MLPASYVLTPRWFHKVGNFYSKCYLLFLIPTPGQRLRD